MIKEYKIVIGSDEIKDAVKSVAFNGLPIRECDYDVIVEDSNGNQSFKDITVKAYLKDKV